MNHELGVKPSLERDCYYCHIPMELKWHFYNSYHLTLLSEHYGAWDFVCPRCGTKEDLLGTMRMKGMKVK